LGQVDVEETVMIVRRFPAIAVACGLVGAATIAVIAMATASAATTAHTVTFVNRSGQTLWIGSRSNSDGSAELSGLPTLASGQSATITLPDNDAAQHWRGTFFAREGCGGSGSGFRCAVGDCGAAVDRCVVGQQPVSLAEFNFDRNDGGAPWYDVSYVDAFSLPVTIMTAGGDESTAAGSCTARPCTGGEMLTACPAENAVSPPGSGRNLLCVNPNRDGASSYTNNLGAFGPRAYLWSTADRGPNRVVFNCPGCSDFVVTFHGDSTAAPGPPAQPAPLAAQSGTHSFRGLGNKCVDVPDGQSNDGAQLQVYDCNGTPAQAFTAGPAGQQLVLGKCLDVAWAGTERATKVQIAWCNGGPAQVWVRAGATLRNPNSNKCLDVPYGNWGNGTKLWIWDCNGTTSQAWDMVTAGSRTAGALRSAAPALPAPAPPAADAGGSPLSGAQYYGVNRGAAAQVAVWQTSRPGDAALMRDLAAVPVATWFVDPAADVRSAVATTIDAATAQGRVALLVAFAVPDRDCGGLSGGGAPSEAAYGDFIRRFAAGIGSRRAVVIVEPDALSGLCGDVAARYRLLNEAVDVLAGTGAVVYLDAGNARWVAPGDMADRLRQAGVARARGFSVNVSSFYSTDESARYAETISTAIGGHTDYVIDTSRNGNGGTGEWCNPAGRALGPVPGTSTGYPHADAYLWIKVPGESDGACNGAPAAGAWMGDYALDLAKAAGWKP
jgi:Glycosyl hydrolases family 6/Thaumatin family/Ricin-type beta-trefoil lectin domain